MGGGMYTLSDAGHVPSSPTTVLTEHLMRPSSTTPPPFGHPSLDNPRAMMHPMAHVDRDGSGAGEGGRMSHAGNMQGQTRGFSSLRLGPSSSQGQGQGQGLGGQNVSTPFGLVRQSRVSDMGGIEDTNWE
jgi:hypothetical protein